MSKIAFGIPRYSFIPILTLAFASSGLEYIPTDSRIYQHLDLLKTSGLIQTLPSSSRPWTKNECLALYLEADSASRLRRVNPAQKSAISCLRRALTPGDERLKPKAPIVISTPDGWLILDFFSRANFKKDTQQISVGARAYNRSEGNFFFYDQFELIGLNPRSPRIFDSSGWHIPGFRAVTWQDRVVLDMERAYFGWELPWVRLEVGRNKLFWGPGEVSSVLLSDKAPALDQIQFSTTYRNFKFIGFTAMPSRWNGKHRFISAQRLEVSLFNRLTLAGAMFNVYSWELSQDISGMFNPLLPVYWTMANAGHTDNLLLGGDAVLYLPQTKIYGQLLIDNFEFNNRKSAPNCVGFQIGTFWVPQIIPIDIKVEYSLVTAFTYYHRIREIMFENYSLPLGHEIGPDADQIWAKLRFTPSPSGTFHFALFTSWTRRGYYNRGDYDRKCFDEAVDTVFLRHYYQFPARGRDSLGNITEEVERALLIGPELELSLLPELYITGRFTPAFYFNKGGVINQNTVELEFLIKLEYRY